MELEPLDDLDAAFSIPEDSVITDEYKHLYEVLVVRLRKEAAGLPMSTVTLLLIERIAFNYVALKAKENLPIGTDGGFAHATIQKDFNTFWLSMTTEFSKQIHNILDASQKETLTKAILSAVVKTASDYIPADVREDYIKALENNLEKEGVSA